MAVWLGEAGGLRFSRAATGRLYVNIQPSDVDVAAKRFGFDRPVTSLITGDSVWFRRVDAEGKPAGGALDFVDATGWLDGALHGDGRWFVHVDAVGGIRLYRKWAEALQGLPGNAVLLTAPSGSYRVSVEVEDGSTDCLAQTISWELNTNREVADVTSLGEGFQKQVETLVSGSGSVDCFFDTNARICDRAYPDESTEASMYLHQLVLRQEIGARFKGVFLLKQTNALPLNALLDKQEMTRELFYACDCIVTEVAVALEPGDAIHSKIQFVTTGSIELRFDYPSDYLVQEQAPNDKVLQETDFGILLEVPA
jgi:hypothetical protein